MLINAAKALLSPARFHEAMARCGYTAEAVQAQLIYGYYSTAVFYVLCAIRISLIKIPFFFTVWTPKRCFPLV